jgi:tetratricopeptide (TPR) repeat protein
MVDPLINQAVSLHQAGRLAEAEGVYRQALAAAPGRADVWYNQGIVLGQLGRFAEAVTAFDQALAIEPSHEAWNNRAAALHRLGRVGEALDSIDRALAAAPTFASALRNRAFILRDLGRKEEALQAFDQLLVVEPGSADAWARRAALLLSMERPAAAVASAERCIALQPEHAGAWASRGYGLDKLDRLAEALASLDRSLAAAPNQPRVWSARGGVLSGLKRHPEALESCQRALELDPGSADALAERAVVYVTLRRHDEALADFQAALQAAPDRPRLWLNYGLTLNAVQRSDEALAAIDRALQMDPADPAIQVGRGHLLCEMGQIGEGLDQFARRAVQVYGGAAPEEFQRFPEAKQRHDAEQQAYLAARGVVMDGFHVEAGARVPGPAVNPANAKSAAEQWAGSHPHVAVIDRLLTEPALEGLRRFCWGSTVWRQSYPQGYLGASVENGFACPLLAQIAEELREVFPTVVGGHGLLSTWGFKYDSQLSGIPVHSDLAAVNVNFWITPDEANLDPDSGGLVVWDAPPPPDWQMAHHNGDHDAMRAFLAERKARPIRVPHRENRAVIFQSDLFHETGQIHFREGYENRRINVTMLYGRGESLINRTPDTP